MIALVAALVVWPIPGPERPVAPEPAAISPGTVLELARPRALPCRRFWTVELEVEAVPDSASAGDPAVISWRAAGRDWRFDTPVWHPLSAPLDVRAFPRRAQLLTEGDSASAMLTFFCQRYDVTEQGMLDHDAEPFIGARWSCKPGGCSTEAGFPMAPAVARSSRRLRLCAKPVAGARDASECTPHTRDIRPAFGDQTHALALAEEIRADAQRTLADACEAAHGCGPSAADVRRLLRPARRQVTLFRLQPTDLTLEARGADKLTLHCSASEEGHNASCDLQLHAPDGTLLLEYIPINEDLVPDVDLDAQGSGWVRITAPLPEDEEPADAGARVSGALLPTAR